MEELEWGPRQKQMEPECEGLMFHAMPQGTKTTGKVRYCGKVR